MKVNLVQTYIKEWKWFKKRILNVFLIVLFIFILASSGSHFYFVKHPTKSIEKYNEFRNRSFQRIINNKNQWEMFLIVFLNNTIVIFLNIILGFIPFLFIPLIRLFKLCLVNGIMSSYIQINGLDLFSTLILGLAPHGIIELPLAIYSYSLGTMLSLQISKNIITSVITDSLIAKDMPLFGQTNEKESESFSDFISHYVKTWFIMLIPLTFVAAFVETFVTPLIVKNFLTYL